MTHTCPLHDVPFGDALGQGVAETRLNLVGSSNFESQVEFNRNSILGDMPGTSKVAIANMWNHRLERLQVARPHLPNELRECLTQEFVLARFKSPALNVLNRSVFAICVLNHRAARVL